MTSILPVHSQFDSCYGQFGVGGGGLAIKRFIRRKLMLFSFCCYSSNLPNGQLWFILLALLQNSLYWASSEAAFIARDEYYISEILLRSLEPTFPATPMYGNERDTTMETLEQKSRVLSSTVGGDGGCRVGEVRAGTTSPIPDHKGFKLQ